MSTGPGDCDSFEEAWHEFSTRVLTDLSERGRDAARGVFFAGGAACFAMVCLQTARDGEQAEGLLDTLAEEFDKFGFVLFDAASKEH